MLWRWPARRYQKPCKPYTGQTNNPQVHHSSGKEPRSIAEHCQRVSSHCFLNKQTVFSRLKSCFQKVFPERFLHFDLLLEILLNQQHRLKDLLDSKPKSSIFRNCFQTNKLDITRQFYPFPYGITVSGQSLRFVQIHCFGANRFHIFASPGPGAPTLLSLQPMFGTQGGCAADVTI